MFTEAGFAIVFAGRMEFCFVCLGQCSLNQSTQYVSGHCHKQSIFHVEEHLQQIGGRISLEGKELCNEKSQENDH